MNNNITRRMFGKITFAATAAVYALKQTADASVNQAKKVAANVLPDRQTGCNYFVLSVNEKVLERFPLWRQVSRGVSYKAVTTRGLYDEATGNYWIKVPAVASLIEFEKGNLYPVGGMNLRYYSNYIALFNSGVEVSVHKNRFPPEMQYELTMPKKIHSARVPMLVATNIMSRDLAKTDFIMELY